MIQLGANPVVFDRGAAPACPKAMLTLALKMRAELLRLGFAPVSFRRSRVRGSSSFYMHAEEGGRLWLVRVSDHAFLDSSPSARPHLDLVSRDGRSGMELALAHAERIKEGDVAWWDAHAGTKPPHRRRRRRRPNRSYI